MIKPVGQSLSAAVEAAKLRESGQTRATSRVGTESASPKSAEQVSTPAARMAAQGAPVDLERVERVKQAIASGQYPVDADKIADRMVDLDLSPSRH